MKTKLFITGLALMVITTLASAQNNGASQSQQNVTGRGLAFVDANKNGICDNYENRTANASCGTRCGSGKCCFQGQRSGQGQKPGNGMGMGVGQGRGRNSNFVDADKNGVCDLYEAAVKK